MYRWYVYDQKVLNKRSHVYGEQSFRDKVANFCRKTNYRDGKCHICIEGHKLKRGMAGMAGNLTENER
jgi:hypothetical protein